MIPEFNFPSAAYKAGLDYTDVNFQLTKRQLAHCVSKSPEWSCQAGLHWDRNRFEYAESKLVEAVLEDVHYTSHAAYGWPKREVLESKIQEKSWSIDILRNGFDSYLWNFQLSSHGLPSGKMDELREILTKELEAGQSSPQTLLNVKAGKGIGKVDIESRKSWMLFWRNTDSSLHEQFLNLPNSAFYTAERAYQFAKGQNKVDQFFEGFQKSLSRGKVEPWANTIVKAFEKSGVGGGNYREVFREVVA